MRLLGIDLETDGLSTTKDQVLEIGWVLIDPEILKPLLTFGCLLKVREGTKISKEITAINHITDDMLKEFGRKPEIIYGNLTKVISKYKVDYIVGHNGQRFDKPMLESNMARFDCTMPEDLKWVDTMTDIEYPKHYKSKNLTYLCAESGFLNPFPHAALFDTMAMMTLLRKHNIKEVISNLDSPCIVIEALVDYDNRDKAGDMGFTWGRTATYVKFPRKWVKEIKENQLESYVKKCNFEINVLNSHL